MNDLELAELPTREDTATQEYLTQLWVSHLGRAGIGLRDDFFEAGGSSMQVIEMLMSVTGKFDRQIDYAEFFKEPTIHRLSELLVA